MACSGDVDRRGTRSLADHAKARLNRSQPIFQISMKWILAIFSLVALFFLLHAAYQEWTGIAVVSSPPNLSGVSTDVPGKVADTARKATEPAKFRRLMNYQWVFACLWAGVPLFIWGVMRKQASLDVFAPDRDDKSSREKP
jgi:hypothetical protein